MTEHIVRHRREESGLQVTGRVVDRERRAAERLRPGLDVSVFALDRPGGRSTLRLAVRGGTAPVRFYLYVDGELVESWGPAPEIFSFDLGSLGTGRHAVTARAIDITGRRGGSSIIVSW
jgi:hypothetical protein